VVADRTRTAVAGWLGARTHDWLARIGTVALDPWRGYASALVVPLGHATVVVDHFHAIKLANTVVDQIRRRTQQATLGHRGRKPDPRYRIRKLLLTAQEQLTSGDECGCGLGLLSVTRPVRWWPPGRARSCCAASTPPTAPPMPAGRWHACSHWCDGVGVAELSRLARTVRTWEAEILAFHSTGAAPTDPPKP
jgi:hypothetical protein